MKSKNEKLIIRLNDENSLQPSREGVKINKIVSSISPSEFIKLLKVADNKVNPRIAKDNRITKAIHDTLENDPALFWLKTKGILLATLSCRLLERKRIELVFSDPDTEGIMDGGHNTLAIASYIAEKLFKEHFKTWEDCKKFWNQNFDLILKEFEPRKDDFQFSIPIEIITPNDEDGADNEYYDCIAEICSARNNNVQLNEASKGYKKGKYDLLEDALKQEFNVIWKSGDSGDIKAEDVISIACLPLLFLQREELLPMTKKQLNKVSIYAQKGRCVDFFNELLEDENISYFKNGKFNILDSYVKSAMDLIGDSLKFFDQVFLRFPDLYHRALPGKFGRITQVETDKEIAVPFHSTNEVCEYKYPAGYYYPLFTGITSLMVIDKKNKIVKWRVHPSTIDFDQLDCKQYISMLKLVGFDPQKVGKSEAFYIEAENIFEKV